MNGQFIVNPASPESRVEAGPYFRPPLPLPLPLPSAARFGNQATSSVVTAPRETKNEASADTAPAWTPRQILYRAEQIRKYQIQAAT